MSENIGKVHQIIGPVIDVKFQPERMPNLHNAIEIKFGEKDIIAEVAQHVGDDVARCIALSSTEGMQRGMVARDCGRPIEVPVGNEVLSKSI